MFYFLFGVIFIITITFLHSLYVIVKIQEKKLTIKIILIYIILYFIILIVLVTILINIMQINEFS